MKQQLKEQEEEEEEALAIAKLKRKNKVKQIQQRQVRIERNLKPSYELWFSFLFFYSFHYVLSYTFFLVSALDFKEFCYLININIITILK